MGLVFTKKENLPISFRIPDNLIQKSKEQAEIRELIHKNHVTSRPLSENYEWIGMMGECAVHLYLGLDVDWTIRPGGDKGKDFIYKGKVLDVKTARKPFNLIREIKKPHGDILILAGINSDFNVIDLIGWEYDNLITKRPYKDFGYGVINHYIPARELRDMRSLLEI